jgi:hypothetical protein
MNDDIGDEFARWWWPGQWLHIVYGVWIDQLWYWQNVRPRLHNWKPRCGILVQGILGSTLVMLVIVMILGALLTIAGTRVEWISLGQRVAVGVILSALWALLVFASPNEVVHGVILIPVLSILLGIWPHVISSEASVAATGVFLGVSYGIKEILVDGIVPRRFRMVATVGFVGVSVLVTQYITYALVGAIAAGLGFYLGIDWATRQVPDVETRRRLANPE